MSPGIPVGASRLGPCPTWSRTEPTGCCSTPGDADLAKLQDAVGTTWRCAVASGSPGPAEVLRMDDGCLLRGVPVGGPPGRRVSTLRRRGPAQVATTRTASGIPTRGPMGRVSRRGHRTVTGESSPRRLRIERHRMQRAGWPRHPDSPSRMSRTMSSRGRRCFQQPYGEQMPRIPGWCTRWNMSPRSFQFARVVPRHLQPTRRELLLPGQLDPADGGLQVREVGLYPNSRRSDIRPRRVE